MLYCAFAFSYIVRAEYGFDVGWLNLFDKHIADLVTKDVDMMSAVVVVTLADFCLMNRQP